MCQSEETPHEVKCLQDMMKMKTEKLDYQTQRRHDLTRIQSVPDGMLKTEVMMMEWNWITSSNDIARS